MGSHNQLIEQLLSLFQIARVEPFGKPAVDRSEQLASLIPLALIAPEPRHDGYALSRVPGGEDRRSTGCQDYLDVQICEFSCRHLQAFDALRVSVFRSDVLSFNITLFA